MSAGAVISVEGLRKVVGAPFEALRASWGEPDHRGPVPVQCSTLAEDARRRKGVTALGECSSSAI